MNPVLINDCSQLPRKDYPRPQWRRSSWMNLNGEWDFAFDFSCSGRQRGMVENGDFPHQILVPFCPESKLSGIHYIDFIPAVWYRRVLSLDTLPSGRALLHFGAVDYLCEVFVNGISAGTHKGGYASFTFDITDLLHAGDNILVVSVQDDLRSGHQPFGKQSLEYKSHMCSYTRTTGIWQTVWLEFVPERYLARARIISHAQDGTAEITVFGCGMLPKDQVRLTAYYNGREAGSVQAHFSGGMAGCFLKVSEIHLWNVGDPKLYDLTVELLDGEGRVVDTVVSYFGLRDVALNSTALMINQKPVFMRLILDQGFHPDGIYTFPDDDCIRRDIELSMALGFNGARLHQRIFEERTLYWADRLGYIVWGEFPRGFDLSSAEGTAEVMPEWLSIIERDFNHPSLIGWIPLNESYHKLVMDPETHRTFYRTTKLADPTRPCIDASGGWHYETDMFDVHDYEQDPCVYRSYFEAMADDPTVCHVPIERYLGGNPRRPMEYKGQPYWVSEYGGTYWNPNMAQNSEDAWGYGDSPRTAEEFAARYEGLTKVLLEHPRICGFCYTQLTDIEQEQNGLYFFDRTRKLPDWVYDRIRNANLTPAAIEEQK